MSFDNDNDNHAMAMPIEAVSPAILPPMHTISNIMTSSSSNAGIFPPAIRPGNTIALISPSARLNNIFPLRVSRAAFALESIGFRVKIIFTPISDNASHADQISHRVHELHSAFKDPEIKAIITTIGGLSANELLPFIDWSVIRQNPKIFCGYSDITLLHLAIAKMTGLRTFYGPAAITQFGEYPSPLPFTLSHFLHVLSPPPASLGKPVGPIPRSLEWTEEFGDWDAESSVLKARKLEKNPGWKFLRAGSGTGRLTGGCLPSLLQLAGTKYFPDFRGKILLLENPEGEKPDGPLPFAQTRSLMADLVNLGAFDRIVGLVVGRPMGYVGDDLAQFEQMVLDMCSGRDEEGKERNFPILAGVDVGHTDPMVTVPLNAVVRVDSKADVWEVLEPGVV
jgi:muramoyltetrapeptide carboxypeptidase LdcA involved in peptidoglycan recycling